MHVSINIPFTTTKDLVAILNTLQNNLKLSGVEVVAAPTPASPPKVEAKSKKKLAPVPAPAPTEAPGQVPIAAASEIKVITKSEATSALQVLNNKKGLPAARIILSKFKTEKDVAVQRLSELKEIDYPKFYELCMAEAEA